MVADWKKIGVTAAIILASLFVILMGSIGAGHAFARPAMPKIILHISDPQALDTDQIELLYADAGSDPYRLYDTLLPDQHLSECRVRGHLCTSKSLMSLPQSRGDGEQSIQILRLQNAGNFVLGGVRWRGSRFPRVVDIDCNPHASSPRDSCRIEKIVK